MGQFGGVPRPIVKYRKYLSRSYSLGSSSDAAVRCQYCGNLLVLRDCAISIYVYSKRRGRMLRKEINRLCRL